MPLSALDVAAAVHLACRLEATAPKPGNVSPGRPFRDMRYEDFLASAEAIGPVMVHAAARPVGVTVLEAVQATMRVAHANTNLGNALHEKGDRDEHEEEGHASLPPAAERTSGGRHCRATVGGLSTRASTPGGAGLR